MAVAINENLPIFDKDSFVPPSKRHLSSVSFENTIEPVLRRYNVTSPQKALLNRAIENETLGFVGYHGAKRDFRIYQDIIRFAFEEVLRIPIREDFHFLRTPGNPQLNVNSAEEFLNRHPGKINDTLPTESAQLLSMNMALYENLGVESQSTVYFFTKNTNWVTYSYESKIEPFFQAIGLDPDDVDRAFAIGRSKLPSSGVLLQIFDSSETPYDLADSQTYLAHGGGNPYLPKEPISKTMADKNKKRFPQIRLILNNKTTLNPFSKMVVRRYDLATPEQRANYETAMRNYFSSLSVDVAKRDRYIEKISRIWGQNLESLKAAA